MFEARVEAAAFDLATEHARLTQAAGSSAGAILSFVGQVRDTPLVLEHYPAMAERELRDLVHEAQQRWPLLGVVVIHRYGQLNVGDGIVLVLVASAHRAAAFEAGTFLMDWLKTSAPFWKKAPDGWVEAKATDDAAAARWQTGRPKP